MAALGKPHPPDPAHVITGSGASGPQQDWDATIEPPPAAGRWISVDEESGPADFTGHANGDFEDGPDRWKQT